MTCGSMRQIMLTKIPTECDLATTEAIHFHLKKCGSCCEWMDGPDGPKQRCKSAQDVLDTIQQAINGYQYTNSMKN